MYEYYGLIIVGDVSMYESFYGFHEKPFSLFPDHRFLYLNRRIKLALNLLEFGVLNKNGMILLTGEPGMGKTTLLQKILGEVDTTVMVGHVTFTQDSKGSFLPWVLKAFNVPFSDERFIDMFQTLSEFCSQVHRRGQGMLLVVDEAQNLEVQKLEELRLLFNLNDQFGPFFQILLAGHTQLRDQLKDPRLTAFVQRIGTDFSLEPLNADDTRSYICHRLRLAGGKDSLFSENACHTIYHCTYGIPRLINQLCEMSLIYGFSEQANCITGALVAEAARDRQHSGLYRKIHDDIPEKPEDGVNPLLEKREVRDDSVKVQVRDEQEVSSSEASVSATGEVDVQGTASLNELGDNHAVSPIHTKSPTGRTAIEQVVNPEKCWEEGIKLRQDGWCLEAIQSFKRAATHSHYHTSSWFQVGQCYLVLGKPTEALKALRNSLSHPQGSANELATIQYTIGQVLEDLDQKDEAQEYYRLAISTDPSFEPSSQPVLLQSASRETVQMRSQARSRPSWLERFFRFFWK